MMLFIFLLVLCSTENAIPKKPQPTIRPVRINMSARMIKLLIVCRRNLTYLLFGPRYSSDNASDGPPHCECSFF